MTANLTIETFPNEAAADYIHGKAVADPTHFGNLPPQLKQRAFTVAGIEQLDALQHIRDAVAKLPEGASWDEAKKEIAAEISPFVGGDDDSKRTTASKARAEFLLRTHGFQAYAVARHQQQMSVARDFPYWKYETVGDSRVRPGHAALDGKVLRADDPWWKTHYPPWDWGCRCIVVAIDEDDAEELGITESEDMPTPGRSGSFTFDPTNVAIDIDKYHDSQRFQNNPADWQTFFINPAKNVKTVRPNGTECTMWELCMDTKYAPIAQTLAKQSRKDRRERAVLIDATTGANLKEFTGDANGVQTGQTMDNGPKTATLHTHTRLGAFPSPTDIRSSLVARSAFDYIAVPGQLRRIDRGEKTIGEDDKQAIMDFDADNAKGRLNKQAWRAFVDKLEAKGIIKMVRVV
ncbi:MAG: minor capsid protein [Kiritimatiellae bacterium]|nr:minor capsid protein [Kiritimatiellia bacterium]MBR6734076.1 minor capsid protein [Kiritimatiellia bacterium]